jgi:hypothetical protein
MRRGVDEADFSLMVGLLEKGDGLVAGCPGQLVVVVSKAQEVEFGEGRSLPVLLSLRDPDKQVVGAIRKNGTDLA